MKRCSCENGDPTEGTDCKNIKAMQCSFCHPGYHLHEVDNKVLCQPNICSCSNGAYAQAEPCPEHQLEFCISCLPDYRLVDFTSSTSSDYRTCKPCPDGYFVEGDGTCSLRICRCTNGQAAYGIDCPNNGAEACAVCDVGFREVRRIGAIIQALNDYNRNGVTVFCRRNICKCSNGAAAEGVDCLEHDGEFCAECQPDYRAVSGDDGKEIKCQPCPSGYYVDAESICQKRVCNCENGQATEGTECPNNNAEHCSSCSVGYYLDSESLDHNNLITLLGMPRQNSAARCLPNVCKCANGAATEGHDCKIHGEEDCEECLENFLMKTGSTNRHAKICEACEEGYHVEGNRCRINICFCNDGVESIGSACHEEGTESCSTCDPGFFLFENNSTSLEEGSTTDFIEPKICYPNVCTCEHGYPVEDDCRENDTNSCRECLQGYRLDGDGGFFECLLNVCTCRNGAIPADGYCREHDTEQCQKPCDLGYHLDLTLERCVLNICFCEVGKPAVGTACVEHETEKCRDAEEYRDQYIELDEKRRQDSGKFITDVELANTFRVLCYVTSACSLFHPISEDHKCDNEVGEILEASYSVGIGFDGTGDYSIDSRKENLIQRHCKTPSYYTIGDDTYVIPSSYSIEPVYETAAKNDYFDSIESYKSDLASSAQMSEDSRSFEKVGSQVQSSSDVSSSSSGSDEYSAQHDSAYTASHHNNQQWTTSKKSCFMFSCSSSSKLNKRHTSGEAAGSNSDAIKTKDYHQDQMSEKQDSSSSQTSTSDNKGSMDLSIEQTAKIEKKTKSFIATSEYKVTLYHLILDNVEVGDLRASFLRDYMTLPDGMFTLNSMKALQNFIDQYGTHYVRAASFGGKFHIRVVSTSSTFSDSKSFNSAADVEMSSMTGSSEKRANQVASSISSKSSKEVESSSRSKEATRKSSSTGEQRSNTDSIQVLKYEYEYGASTRPLTGGIINVGGSVTTGGEISATTSAKSWNDQGTMVSESSSSSEAASSAMSDAEKADSARKDASHAEALDEAKEKRSNANNVATDRENISKSKSTYYRVDGGTKTAFTSYFYTENYAEYFSEWVESVRQDPKPFDLKVRPITDLLRISAFDFFPECTLQCLYTTEEATNCAIYSEQFADLNVDNPQIFTCSELARISRTLERKRNNLADAIHMYLNNGKLTPEPRQLIKAGPKGCTQTMLLAQRQQRRIRYQESLGYDGITGIDYVPTSETPNYIPKTVKLNMFLPRDITNFFIKNINIPTNCENSFEYKFFERNAELFVIYDRDEKKWIPCLDASGSECSLTRKSPSMDLLIGTVPNEISGVEEAVTINDVIPFPVCYSFLCFNYEPGFISVTEGTLKLLDYYVDLMSKQPTWSKSASSKNKASSVSRSTNQTNQYTTGGVGVGTSPKASVYTEPTDPYMVRMLDAYQNLSCQTSQPLFLANGMDLVTMNTYLTLEQSVGERVAEVYTTDDDAVDEATDPELWAQTIPAVPQYCEIAWSNAQRFSLATENQCIYYAVTGTDEYFLALSDNPSSEDDSVFFMHHNKRGICIHGTV